jgi:hypothetical protein
LSYYAKSEKRSHKNTESASSASSHTRYLDESEPIPSARSKAVAPGQSKHPRDAIAKEEKPTAVDLKSKLPRALFRDSKALVERAVDDTRPSLIATRANSANTAATAAETTAKPHESKLVSFVDTSEVKVATRSSSTSFPISLGLSFVFYAYFLQQKIFFFSILLRMRKPDLRDASELPV